MEKLDTRSKWCYSIGATGRDAAYAFVSMFLLNYIQYTMKLTTAQFAAIGIIIVICMVWDAINDPLMGIIVENSHMKMGKYRPWILMGSILNAAVIIALFTLRPTGWGFVGFFAVGYLVWGMTYTMNDIAYWGMLPSLTSDPKERNWLVTMMGIFICVGQFSVAGVLPMIIAGNAVNTYKIVALIVGLCFIAFQALTVLGVKEKKHAAEDNVDKLSLKDMFKIFARNDQLVPAGISSLLFTIANNLLIMFGISFFYFEFGYSEGGNLATIFTVMYGLGTLLSEAVFPSISKKFKRKPMLNFFTLVTCAAYFLFFAMVAIHPNNPNIKHALLLNQILLNVLGFVIFFGQGLINMLIIVMLNNTIEYDEVKFNERHDSIISTVRSFTAKLGGAISQGCVNLTLILSGLYAISRKISELEAAAGEGEITKEEVLSQADILISEASNTNLLILRICIAIIPIVVLLVSLLVINKKYKIDEVEYNRLVEEIKTRNEGKYVNNVK